ncbi:zinc finger protein 777-like isoform X2 [Ambystoma mexicanum]|uniref:zinc finger protein 777-like isoform X2 n=1 Tax=Ambystoma mexicanum TaxID=8296 RepID=UPI0037E8744E
MSRCYSDKAPVTFRDVAAYFSEEEWKLLRNWQKELYKNAMKAIHQAMISLGYTIANPDTLLRIQKRDRTFVRDPQDTKRRLDINDPTSSCYPSVSPDILLRIVHKENRHQPEQMGILHSPNTVNTHTGFDASFRLHRKTKLHWRDPLESERSKVDDSLDADYPVITSVFSLSQGQEPGPHFRRLGPKGSNAAFQHKEKPRFHEYPKPKVAKAGPLVPPLIILLDEDPPSEKESEPERAAPGNRPMSRKKKGQVTINSTKKSTSYESSSGKVKLKVLKKTDKRAHLGKRKWPESHDEFPREKTAAFENGVKNPAHSTLYQAIPKLDRTDKYEESESTQKNTKLPEDHQKTQQTVGPYDCDECGKSFRHNINLIQHRIMHAEQKNGIEKRKKKDG